MFCVEVNIVTSEIQTDSFKTIQTFFRPEIGHVVAVEKKDDDGVKWVRGVVCAINNNTYECALIDYGVKQLCQEVRRLPEKYIKIPNFSCICEADADTIQKVVEVFLIFLMGVYFFLNCNFVGRRWSVI